MEQALQRAQKAKEEDEVPVGAVLVGPEGTLLAQGFNRRENLCRTLAHAEIQALEAYHKKYRKWRFYPDTSLYVTVEPCLMCTGALLWARVDHIYFAAPDPKGAGLLSLKERIERGDFDHRFKTIRGGIMLSEAAQLLKDYFRQKRRTKNPNLYKNQTPGF